MLPDKLARPVDHLSFQSHPEGVQTGSHLPKVLEWWRDQGNESEIVVHTAELQQAKRTAEAWVWSHKIDFSFPVRCVDKSLLRRKRILRISRIRPVSCRSRVWWVPLRFLKTWLILLDPLLARDSLDSSASRQVPSLPVPVRRWDNQIGSWLMMLFCCFISKNFEIQIYKYISKKF